MNQHGIPDPNVAQYPATLMPEWGKSIDPVECGDDVQLEEAVVAYCGGAAVQEVVTGLLAQARQAMGEAT